MVRTDVGNRERVNFYMDRSIMAGVKKLAALKNMTYSELIRQACFDYIMTEGPKAMAVESTIQEITK